MDSVAIMWRSIGAGIAAGMLLQALAAIFKQIILPWYQQVTFNGVDICGHWYYESVTPSGMKIFGNIQVAQHADQLNVSITKSQSREGSDTIEIKTYKLSGSLRDRLVILGGNNINPKQLGRQVYLLEVVNGGMSLTGSSAWYSPTKQAVDHQYVDWVRKDT